MLAHGQIIDGTIVVEGDVPFPDGTRVVIAAETPAANSGSANRVQLPLVPSKRPGSVHLDAERVADLLSDDAPA